MTRLILFALLAACSTEPPAPPATPAAPPAPAAHAHAEGEHHEADKHHEATEDGDEGEGEGDQASLPSTYADAMAELKTQAEAARALSVAGKLAEIHPVCERIEALSVALPGMAAGLPEADRAKVMTGALAVKKTVGTLHHVSDEGKVAETNAQLDALDAGLAGLPAAG